MSEYQYYEFVALDRPLTSKEIAELRSISTRAEISSTRFQNHYEWGDLKADPKKLLERYFDAHFYFANWGTRRFMLRLPALNVDVAALKPYFVGECATMRKKKSFVILEFYNDAEDDHDIQDWYDDDSRLAALIPLRAQIMSGDITAAYIAWLSGLESGCVPENEKEPPVPPGLADLSGPVMALAELLRVDPDLIAAAAEGSSVRADDTVTIHAWLRSLPTADKDRWLRRAIDRPDSAPGVELRAEFRKRKPKGRSTSRRTASELLLRAEEVRAKREAAEAVAKERARVNAVRARVKKLDALAKRQAAAWRDLEALLGARTYDRAVEMAVDLREVAQRGGTQAQFEERFAAIRKKHGRRHGFFSEFMRRTGGEKSR